MARAWSGYVDSLAGGSISNYTRRIMHGYTMAEPLGTIPDFLAAGLCLAYAMLLALGVKCSATVNSFLTTINLGVMGLVIGLGIYYAKFSNWSYDFMPFGFSGVLAGISEFIDFRLNLNREISYHPSNTFIIHQQVLQHVSTLSWASTRSPLPAKKHAILDTVYPEQHCSRWQS